MDVRFGGEITGPVNRHQGGFGGLTGVSAGGTGFGIISSVHDESMNAASTMKILRIMEISDFQPIHSMIVASP